jgi:serine protease
MRGARPMRVMRLVAAGLAAAALPAGAAAAEFRGDNLRDVLVLFEDAAARNDFLHTPAAVHASAAFGLVPVVAARLTESEAAELAARTGVVLVEPDGQVWKLGQPGSGGGDAVPYGVDLVRARGVWPITRGGGVRVAVLDTGLDPTNPDAPVPVLSASFVPGESSMDVDGHGSHVAGTIAARGNGAGVIGVAPEVELLVGKVLSTTGGGSFSDVIAGLEWAVANGARVINMSLGGSEYNAAFEAACAAAEASGALIVAASGNAGGTFPIYPANFASVLSVSAVDRFRNWASYSQNNAAVAIAGPGTSVWSSVRRQQGMSVSNVVFLGAERESRFFAGSTVGQVRAEMVWCGFGCSAADFPASVAGRIAVIRRGGCAGNANLFRAKVALARAAGAVGIVIANNQAQLADGWTGTLEESVPAVVLSLSQADGDALQAALTGGATVLGTLSNQGLDHVMSTGTSMASPHVAGVAAMLFSVMGPSATPAQVRAALIAGAVRPPAVLPPAVPVRDTRLGFGVLNAPASLAAVGAIVDCNNNGTSDHLEIAAGTLADVDGDGRADVCVGESVCRTDYNADGVVNLDDLGDFVTDFYTVPAIPGGVQPLAPTLGTVLAGGSGGIACPLAGSAPLPYGASAYRQVGYRAAFALEGTDPCPPSGPNLDHLGDYITAFYAGLCG